MGGHCRGGVLVLPLCAWYWIMFLVFILCETASNTGMAVVKKRTEMHIVKVNFKNHRCTFKCKKLLVFLALYVCFFISVHYYEYPSVHPHLCLSPCWLSVIQSLLARPTRSSLTWHWHSQAVDYYLPHCPYQQADGMGSICLAAVSVCSCGVNGYTLITTT